jgi:2-oxoglutarate/2-oxoacid ferredoxin oxidoreductase subunit alpha
MPTTEFPAVSDDPASATNGHVKVERRERVIVRFAGDSGDGMQLAGGRFTDATAVFGNDLATLPNFPAEIRAPAGSLAGVSSFQIHFASRDIATPGDLPNVLVAMNPAALKANLSQVERGATIIVNEDAFSTRNLQKAGYEESPLEDDSLDAFQVKRVPMTTIVTNAIEGLEGATSRDAQRARNLFALGLVSWLYDRPTEGIERWIEGKFASKPHVREVNLTAFRAGWNFGETSELIDVRYEVLPARDVPPGVYRNVNGTATTALGLVAASVRSGLPLVLSAYPITPASELLHDLATRKSAGVRTIQAEDEIAAAGIALGAAFGGALGVTATSGPGLDLKAETIGLAVALELPMVIVDVQRAGPSTGMPTKTEQSDLLAALYGRHGESPVPIVAASTPGQCFDAAYEAVRIAVRYRTPVILLTDLFLANGSEPWRIPNAASLPAIDPAFAKAPSNGAPFQPYARNADGARPWAIPGTPGLAHRIGGLEKQDLTGEISYDSANHARMTELRAAKVAGIEVPDVEVDHQDGADVLVIGWGSSAGAIRAGVRRIRVGGRQAAFAHLHHLNPLPANLGEVLRAYRRVLLPEMNSGQLARVLRSEYLVDVRSYTRVEGRPLFAAEIEQAILEEISTPPSTPEQGAQRQEGGAPWA